MKTSATILLSLLLCAGSSEAAGYRFTTFDHEFHNWADPHEQSFEFPPHRDWSQVLIYYTIECPGPPDDCDPWDRLGHLRVVEDDGQGNKVFTEIARIITPYDITGGSRPGSCSWTFDVTDYQSLLRDTVTLQSYIESWIGGTRGWLVTIEFQFSTGPVTQDPFRVDNLYQQDRLVYGDPANPHESHLLPVQVDIDVATTGARVRSVVTGHGQGNTDNAAEFAKKIHEIQVGTDLSSKTPWRSDCNTNPCSPQGGTWQYPRAGWCPGDKVYPWIIDATPSITAGQTVTIDYNIEAYENFCRPTNPSCVSGSTCPDCNYNSSGHTEPHFTLQTQLIQYRDPVAYDYVVGEGLGRPNGNRVRVFDASGVATAADFQAYGAARWGVNVSSGNVDGGDHDEILTGPGPGDVFGPQVRAFRRDATPVAKINYYAYGTLKFGVNVGGPDVDGDPFAEILSGAGRGEVFGPHVRGWNFDATQITAIQKINYFAYSTLKYGVNVAGGDLDRDWFDELLTGPGPGAIFGPQVRGWNVDGSTLTAIGAINFTPPYSPAEFGVRVASGDVDGDLFAEIVTVPGPSPNLGCHVLGYDFDGQAVSALVGYDTVAFPGFYGGSIGLGDLTIDATAELVAAGGVDPAADSTTKSYQYLSQSLQPWGTPFVPFSGAYGASVGAGRLGY